jgi:hypothetical protein
LASHHITARIESAIMPPVCGNQGLFDRQIETIPETVVRCARTPVQLCTRSRRGSVPGAGPEKKTVRGSAGTPGRGSHTGLTCTGVFAPDGDAGRGRGCGEPASHVRGRRLGATGTGARSPRDPAPRAAARGASQCGRVGAGFSRTSGGREMRERRRHGFRGPAKTVRHRRGWRGSWDGGLPSGWRPLPLPRRRGPAGQLRPQS